MKACTFLEKKAFPNLLSPIMSGVNMAKGFGKNLVENNGFGNAGTLQKVVGRGSLGMGFLGVTNAHQGAEKVSNNIANFKGQA